MSSGSQVLDGWSAALEARLVELAEDAAPEEACGLLVRGPNGRLHAPSGANIALDPRLAYELDPAFVLHWTRAEESEVVGVWHSHPQGPPSLSRADRDGAPTTWWQVVVGRCATNGWHVRRYPR